MTFRFTVEGDTPEAARTKLLELAQLFAHEVVAPATLEPLPVDIAYALSPEHSAALRREEAAVAAAASDAGPAQAADDTASVPAAVSVDELRDQIKTLFAPHIGGPKRADILAFLAPLGGSVSKIPVDALPAALAGAKKVVA